MPKPLRVSLTLSGGASLGAYQAGATAALLVALEHGGWKDGAPEMVAQGWKHFLQSMKAYLETGTGMPW